VNDPDSLAEYVYLLVKEVYRKVEDYAQTGDDITSQVMESFLSNYPPEERLRAMKHVYRVRIDRREIPFRIRQLSVKGIERDFSEISSPLPISFIDALKLLREVDKSVTSMMKLDNVYNSILGRDVYGGVLMTEEAIVKFLSSMRFSREKIEDFVKFLNGTNFSIKFKVGHKNFFYFLPLTLDDSKFKVFLNREKTSWDPSYWIGKRIGGLYEVEDVIAKGGNSYVLKGRAESFKVALKIPVIVHDPGRTVLITGNTLMDMFKEVAVVKGISKKRKEYLVEITGVNFSREHIIKCLRDPSFYYENPPYIAMEYMEGGTLRSIIQERYILSNVWEEVVSIVALSIAKGIASLHEEGLVHLDVKPSNVLLTSPVRGGGEELLADLKSGKLRAKLSDLGSVTRIGEKVVHATPCYAPGDQIISGLKGLGSHESMDVYAFGATIYEMLTGKMLNFSITEKMNDAITLHDVNLAEEAWNNFNPDKIEGKMGEIISSCVSKDPSRRPSIKDVVKELEKIVFR